MAKAQTAEIINLDNINSSTWQKFLDVLTLIERLHRLLLDVIKDDLVSKNQLEINSVQALLLYHVGPHEFSATELRQRGYYQGSNVSYNLKKLVDAGYVECEKNQSDRRAVRIRLTEEGEEMRAKIDLIFERIFIDLLSNEIWQEREFHVIRDNLVQVERYFRDQIRYIY